MKEQFIAKRFSTKSKEIVTKAQAILTEYERYTLTLRQLYYQFVARGYLPNHQKEYKRLGSIINDARLAGLIDWDLIEDRTRFLRRFNTWDHPQQIIHDSAQHYRRDWWDGQRYRPEVWIEKDALIGVIQPVCNEFQVPYFACRGYSSQSEQYRAARRLTQYGMHDQEAYVLYLGDHDPSGMDMTRDHESRLELFGCDATVLRLALNMEQIRRYNPPPNPNKETDSRTGEYARQYGPSCWELDALAPDVIENLVRNEIQRLIQPKPWKLVQKRERKERRQLADLARRM